MQSAQYWINSLNLLPHPEGGFYKETYRAAEVIPGDYLPKRFKGERNVSTAIYFLLRGSERSLFHRIKSDELWHFHSGNTLNIFVLTREGLITFKLGSNPERGESLQIVIPANHWFGAMVNEQDGYTLSSCTVAPGFDFQDFELADRFALLKDFPSQEEIIKKLTKP